MEGSMPMKRPRQPMPEFVKTALHEQQLQKQYEARPPYQRNDYLGWIAQAKRTETREKRIAQMLEELAGGRLYMKMRWSPKT